MPTLSKKIRSLLTAYSKWKGSSINRNILGAAVIVAVFTGIAKIVLFAKELTIAWQFGTLDLLDAFLIAYVVPSFAINWIAESINAALIPAYVKAREQEGQISANDLYGAVMTLGIVFLTVCTGLIVVSAPVYLRILASGFSQEKLRLTLNLFYVVSPVIILSGITTIRGAVLNAGERFAVPALIPVVTPLMTIAFILIGARALNIYSIALSLVFGQSTEVFLLGLALKRHGVKRSPVRYSADANLRQVIRQFLPLVAGAFFMGSTQLVDQAMAASLPAGNVAVLNYGNKVISFPLHIAATAIGTSVLPYFSSVLARNDWRIARQILKRYLKLTFVIAVPATLLLVHFSEPLVRLLLQRGAFNEQDTKIVADVLAFGALHIPLYLGGILLVRLLSALRANHIIMWSAFLNMIVNITGNYLLMKIYGVVGISFSTSIAYFVSFSMLLISVKIIFSRNRLNND